MSGHDTMRRDGGWTVELITPTKNGSNQIDEIDLRPTTGNDVIAWGRGEVLSTLALASRLSDVPEAVLRSLTSQDLDRVLKALYEIMPPALKKDFEEGNRPFATPDEAMTPEQRLANVQVDLDPVDPRFPRADGPVVRMTPQKSRPEAAEEPSGTGLDAEPPLVAKLAG